jgi:dihydroorotase-like cyclic amidohydrolase
MDLDLLIKDGLICTEDAPPLSGTVGVREGRIVIVAESAEGLDAREVIDARDRLVMPGMIDPHVHIGHGAPHPSEFWTEGSSAVIGGVTTMLTYYRRHPFNYLDLVPELIAAGKANSPIDFSIHLPLFTRQSLEELPLYRQRFGINGFKFFPGIKGSDAAVMTALPHTGPMLPIDDRFVLDGMRALAAMPGTLALYHAENPELNAAAAARVKAEGRADLRAWCDSRPDYGEAHSVRDGIWWQRLTGAPLYIVHLSSAIALEAVLEERQRGPRGPLWVETCPQFLTHTRDSRIGTIGKMSPPFRTTEDCERLWRGIATGEIQTIASDHGAFMREDKTDAWSGRSGFPGLATILPALMTHGVGAGRIAVSDVVRVFSANTARIFGLFPRKGTLTLGADADVIVVDDRTERVVEPRALRSRSDFSIYEGQTLTGWPTHVVSRGRVLLRKGEFVAERGGGRFLGTRQASGQSGTGVAAS